MPLPKPNEGESQDDFISRCMSDDQAVEDFPDNDQRLAVCHDIWEGGKQMADMIKKTFRVAVKEVDAENGTIDMVIPMSTGSVDRDGEIIEPNAFKKTLPKFKKRPILLSSHDYRSLQNIIGEFAKIQITDEGLMAMPKYYIGKGNPEADWAFLLASKGMAAFSVAFIPIKSEPMNGDGDDNDNPFMGPPQRFTEVELLEISQVVVPSNRDAIQSMKSKGIKDAVINEIVDEVLADDELMEFKAPEKEEKPSPSTNSQESIADELDFIYKAIGENGLNKESLVIALKLASEILRLAGDDIPDDIKEKVSAVLSQKNRQKLEQIQDLARGVINSAEESEETIPEPEEKKEITPEQIAQMVGFAVKTELDRLRGKIQ